jgi:signal transduction histidine kinase/CheY-like chemotaxis protein
MSDLKARDYWNTSALFASRQFVLGRIPLSGFIAFSAYTLGSKNWPIPWFLMLTAAVLIQFWLIRNFQRRISIKEIIFRVRAALSMFDTTMYAAAAAAIAQTDTALSGGFAIFIVLLTMTYVLMHFYMQPRLMLLLNAPCFLSLIICLGGHTVLHGATRDPLRAAIPLVGAIFAIFFMLTARRHLSRARRALVQSRSDALAREDEALAASRSKSDFLAIMGHEIRTPLNGVLGIVQVMGQGDLSEAQRTQLNIIRESGETLLVILNDLLDISKIEAGKMELELATFSMRALARGVHATFSAAAGAKDLDFTLSIEEGAEGLYQGDETRLRQILYNLVANAVKFTTQGEVRVRVAQGDGGLVFTVSDTGIGVPAERQKGLFEKFVQADTSTTRRYGGTGLGLSIANQLVQKMGGSISLNSVEGVGSIFTARICLPRVGDEPAAALITAEAAPDREAAAGEMLCVLVAEDNLTNQIVIKLMLAQVGVEPTIVENGRQALAAWEAQTWDVILMDIQMPEMDGMAATMQIRRREVETGRPRTPILALTANAMTHQRLEYIASGMDDLVSKPIDFSCLFEALTKNLSPHSEADTGLAA